MRIRMLPGGFQAQVIGRVLNAALLATGGLSERDIRTVPTPTQFTGVDLLGEGKVDAAVISVGTAQAQRAHAELSSRGGVRFLDLGNAPSVAAANPEAHDRGRFGSSRPRRVSASRGRPGCWPSTPS